MHFRVLLSHSYHCDCSDTGFEGNHCEVDILECASEPCLNNATCVEGIKNYSCACWPGRLEIWFAVLHYRHTAKGKHMLNCCVEEGKN